MEKPGKCASLTGEGSCVTSCNNDWDCSGLLKCCQISCGRMCQDPCYANCDIACEEGKECKVIGGCAKCIPAFGAQPKPGKCATWTGASVSLKNCESDSNCPGSKKCCSVGQGKLCQDPCSSTCNWNCLSGTKCSVGNDGCAQCVPSST